MQKKQIAFKTKGMNRDLSVSAFSPEFAFENINLRLSTNDDNTSMSWVNEKGTAAITTIYQEASDGSATSTTTQLSGTPVGKAEINHYLVVFTHDSVYDHIYRLKYSNADKTEMSCCTLYTGHLGFDNNHPLETLVSYEAEDIQKVYWTDGKNQPRLINIMADPNTAHYNDTAFDFIPTLRLRETVTVQKQLNKFGEFPSGVIQYAFTYYRKYGQESNIFYTSPLLYISPKDRGASPEEKVANAFQIDIDNADTNFDYVRIYSIIRTSLNATPYVRRVQDLEIFSSEEVPYSTSKSTDEPRVLLTGRAESEDQAHVGKDYYIERYYPDSSVRDYFYGYRKSHYPNLVVETSSGFVKWGPHSTQDSVIWVSETANFEDGYYCIAASVNADAEDYDETLFYSSNRLCFVDTGDMGESVDPTELLYKGGETIYAQTLEQKNNTLFFGNISQGREEVLDDIDLTGSTVVGNSNRRIYTDLISSDSIYPYANQLTAFSQNNGVIASTPCGGFKRGDFYRLGVQFQHETGRWSDPIFIGDSQIANGNYPSIGIEGTSSYVQLPIFTGTINSTQVNAILAKHYLKARPVVVFPDFNDRVVVCQGVINSTLYTEKHRDTTKDNDLYAQSSWFFRPFSAEGTSIIGADQVTVSPYFISGNTYLPYTDSAITDSAIGDLSILAYNPEKIRAVEIQGQYSTITSSNGTYSIDNTEKFKVSHSVQTLHSPDIVFANSIRQAHLEGVQYRLLGKVSFQKTLSDILIELESPAAASSAGGFIHKSFEKDGSYGIVSGLFFEDWVVDEIDGKDPAIIEKWRDEKSPVKWLVYPWQRTGSLNNDIRRPGGSGVRSAVLKRKVISNLRIANTIYSTLNAATALSGTPKVFSADYVDIIKIGSDEDHIYEGNIDTAVVPKGMDGLYFAFDGETHTGIGNSDLRKNNIPTSFESTKWWKTFNKDDNVPNERTGLYYYNTNQWSREENLIGDEYIDLVLAKSPVRITYKSTPHMVVEFDVDPDPSVSEGESILPIIEIVRPGDRVDGYRHTMFGGTSEDALKSNRWIPCGEPVRLVNGSDCVIKYEYGDTYFQRWDCLKTYAFTREDFNQIVEIGSFMLESHVNCDGRYDRNRGQKNNTHMSPENFNLLNDVYTQQNNFFSYRIHDEDTYKRKYFPNQITWTKTKKLGDVVDMWTSLTLASVLELDGDKGSVTSLQRLNDQLICFQDKGFSQILYNENVQLSSTQGVPIELANSGKVQGFRYYNNSVGCSNKWSIANTPSGIYFMDSNDKSIFLFNGQLSNLSLKGGLNTWCKKNIPDSTVKWTPDAFSNFIAHYDTLNQDVLFVNSDNALAFSERVGTFTSFYSYGNTPFLCSLDDTAVWIKSNSTLHRHNAGNYCEFFGESKDFSLTLVGNPEYLLDKVFTNLEFRAIVDGEGSYDSQTGKFTPTLPFDSIEVWNEFQHGISGLSNMVGHSDMQHFVGANSSLKRKFRIWRCDIPRDNYTYSDISTESTKQIEREHSMGIYRNKVRPIDRMRNNWIYLNLKKSSNTKVEIHDIVMTYYT